MQLNGIYAYFPGSFLYNHYNQGQGNVLSLSFDYIVTWTFFVQTLYKHCIGLFIFICNNANIREENESIAKQFQVRIQRDTFNADCK